MYVVIIRVEEKLCISFILNKYGKKVDKLLFINDIKFLMKKEIDSIGVGDKVYYKKFYEGEIIKKDGIMFIIKFKDRE